jgi:hypothetical protein
MITKEQAIYNVTKAYLEYKVFGRLFWDDRSGDIDVQSQTRRDYFKADARYDTMAEAYIHCGVLTWTEIETATNRYKLDRFDEPNQ